MMKWHVGFVVPTIGLFMACSSAPKTPVVSTELPPQNSATATNSAAPVTPEPSATVVVDKPPPKKEEPIAQQEEESEDEGVEGGVPGGIAGGPRFDAVVGVPGGVVGGVVGGVQSGIVGGNGGLGMPNDVLMPGNPLLTQARCPHPGAPPYPQAAKDAQVEATIVARCIAEKNGSLTCKLVKSHPLFEKPMLDHLNKSKVPPMTTTDGKPARVMCMYTYRYKIQ